MSDTVTNLKVRFGADTKNFKADLESGKAAVDKFTGSAKSAFSDFAKIFGVNIDAISGSISGVNKSLSLFSAGLKGSTEGASIFAAAMRIIKLALVSTGVGAIVVVFGALVAYFTKTSEGANFVKRSMASLGAIFRELTDRASDLGKFLFDAFSKPKETIKDLWEFLKSQLINRIEAVPRLIEAAWNIVKGIFKGGVGDAAKDMASAMAQLTTGLDKDQQSKIIDYIKGVGTAMTDEAKKAWELEQATQNLKKAERELGIIQAKRADQVSQLRLAAKDYDADAQTRLDALKKAIEIQKTMGADEEKIEKERLRILKEQSAMHKLLGSDKQALADQEIKLYEVTTRNNNEIRAMSREYIKLTKEVEANRKAVEEANKTPLMGHKELKSTVKTEFKTIIDKDGNKEIREVLSGSYFQTSKLEAKAAKIQSIYGGLKSTVMDFSQVFTESMNAVAVGFGESLGNMLAGTGKLSDLGAVVLSSLADLAIQVGKIAIGVGIATLGIKKALETLNPVVAIAAGVALVALGTLAKSALSSAASGGSGTFSSAGSGSYDTTGGASVASPGSLRSAPMTINITGTFRAQGRDLVAVLDKNNLYKTITT